MQQYTSPEGHLLVINKGEEAIAALQEFALKHDLAHAWMQGLGGAAHVTLGFYNLETKEYQWRAFDYSLEILSLQGNLAWVNEQPVWHVHGVFSDSDYVTIGGHVKKLIVGLTCELFITPTALAMTRRYDDETGLQLLAGDVG